MKKQILSVIVTLSVIITLSIAGFAGLRKQLEANIPFDFMVNGKTLPAGKYVVVSGIAPHALTIRSWETKQGAVAITQECKAGADSRPQLIFRRYGDQYFLAKVVSDMGGNELMKSKAEREAAKAKRDDVAEIITINAQVGQ